MIVVDANLPKEAYQWCIHPVEQKPSQGHTARKVDLVMRITSGTVVGGHVVVEGESLDEGSTVTVLIPDDRTFTLSEGDEAALLEAIAEADRGDVLDSGDVLKELSGGHNAADQDHSS